MKSLDNTSKHISEVITNNITIRGAARGVPTDIPRGTVCGRAVIIHRTQNRPGWHVYGDVFHVLPHRWQIAPMNFVQFVTM